MSPMPDEKMHTRCSSPRRTDQSRPGTAHCLYLCLNKQKKFVRFKRFVLLLHLYPSIPRTRRFVGLRSLFSVAFAHSTPYTKDRGSVRVKAVSETLNR
jgi:hypothetical protein